MSGGEPGHPDGAAGARAWLRLAYCPGVGPVALRRLLQAFGLPEQVLAGDPRRLRSLLPAAAVTALLGEPAPALRELLARADDWLAEPGNHLITLADPRYPRQLLDIPDPPPLLWARGDPGLLSRRRMLAVVGTRQPSAQGARDAREFALLLARGGITVVSGLARGVDAEAHRGALQAGESAASTVAVLGTGCDRVYPAAHRELAREVAGSGLLVSEFALGQAPLPAHFPRRNRIISGLCAGVLVTEAALRSGSLITARLAADQGREVFAMPGSIHNPAARGCHQLLREGARLAETVDDILDELGWHAGVPAACDDDAPPPLEPAAREVLECMGFDALGFDQLQARSARPTSWLLEQLLELEMRGRIQRLPGGRLQRIERAGPANPCAAGP